MSVFCGFWTAPAAAWRRRTARARGASLLVLWWARCAPRAVAPLPALAAAAGAAAGVGGGRRCGGRRDRPAPPWRLGNRRAAARPRAPPPRGCGRAPPCAGAPRSPGLPGTSASGSGSSSAFPKARAPPQASSEGLNLKFRSRPARRGGRSGRGHRGARGECGCLGAGGCRVRQEAVRRAPRRQRAARCSSALAGFCAADASPCVLVPAEESSHCPRDGDLRRLLAGSETRKGSPAARNWLLILIDPSTRRYGKALWRPDEASVRRHTRKLCRVHKTW